ncbi:hypothetical protein HPP92_008826 [Vanilla planifolia]|uniref:Protein kinase domain-containing protein n=1 Tax=Vanilla planifolia TaxID=51239 RepID=A0A835V894_VANPL|nr:hypothetical protein HPP92_008826 [Vanilla planifolia]
MLIYTLLGQKHHPWTLRVRYVAPEYAMTGHLLVKSDVYSFGVVMLELLTGRKPVYMTTGNEPENLVTCARPLLSSKEGLEQLIDPSLKGSCNFDDFARVAAVASMCVHPEASHRPFMGEVVQALKMIYNDMDDTNEDSCSQRGSSSCQDCDFKGDFALEGSWWSGDHLALISVHRIQLKTCTGLILLLLWLGRRWNPF